MNPEIKGKELQNGTVIDCNSLYPYVMRTKLIPYGEPLFFEGQYKYDKNYPLYVQQLYCKFKIKQNKIPTIMKKRYGLYSGNLYMTESDKQGTCLTLTNIDLKRFFENYDVDENSITYLSGWKFKAMHGIFDKYVDTWVNIKNFATKNKVAYLRQIAKLMLNGLYGKLATNQDEQSKQSYVDENGIVRYTLNEKGKKTGRLYSGSVLL